MTSIVQSTIGEQHYGLFSKVEAIIWVIFLHILSSLGFPDNILNPFL